jgi:sedoheptulokinase
MDFLLVDFGTTSVKTAIANLDTGTFSLIRSHQSVPNCTAVSGHYEVPPLALRDRFLSICDMYFNQLGIQFEGIVICSEQNGFVALNQQDQPITNYVSWKDERSLEPIDGRDTYSLLTEALGEKFKRITGWRPGPGLPVMNVAHLARLSLLETPCKIVSLPEWLSLCCDDSNHVVHDTMLHGLGFYDVRDGETSSELTGLVEELTGVQCAFSSVAPTGSISGYWHSPKTKIPIYVGIGDHQCSVLGACNVPGESISINLGTGSQVAIIDPDQVPKTVELRPYFDSSTLAAITRIPGGRALASFLAFLEDICEAVGVNDVDFWAMLKEIDERDILNATMKFDLSVFSSAWNYKGGGNISNIQEDSLTLKNYLASLMKAFGEQYLEVMKLFDPEHRMKRCILSGGVARRIPVLFKIISSLSGYETLPACEIDESLIGLRTVALVSAGRAQTCFEAQEIYGRGCFVDGTPDGR